MPSWTIANPYKNPFKELTFRVPGTDGYERPENSAIRRPRADNRLNGTGGYQWVMTEKSLQWDAFVRSVQLLRERGNRVFVLVGPFNEHTLKGTSLDTYQKLKGQIEQWFLQNNIAYYMPPVLPVKIYQDASHPLSEGYAMIAKQLFENESFKSTILHAAKPNLSGQ